MDKYNGYDVLILGAGAAGLMCALTAGQLGLSVLVLEKSNKPGKKILMSGGGRCNFTNMNTQAANFLSDNPHFCKSALSQYSQWDFIQMVEKHQIPYHEKELGQLFCNRSSKDILNMLLDECALVAVEIRLNVDIKNIDTDSQVMITTNQGTFKAINLVVATGGLSIPKMGGSDFGYQLAEQLGLAVIPKRAGLVPFIFTDRYQNLCAALAGTAIPVKVDIGSQSFSHQLLFTHRGLSGPAILQISSYWQTGDVISINLLPEIDAYHELTLIKKQQPNFRLNQWLSQYLPKKVTQFIVDYEFPKWSNASLQMCKDKDIEAIAAVLNGWQLKPSGTEGYRTAEVTLGGVDTRHLSSRTMACVAFPHIYFIGEVVDVTGHLGGYNFQWAWSSGYAAAQAIYSN